MSDYVQWGLLFVFLVFLFFRPQPPSSLPWPQGDCLCNCLASISICLALASGWLPLPRPCLNLHLPCLASGWRPRPCLVLHLPCLGLGVAAAALPWSPSTLPRPRGGGLGLALISIYLASASGWRPRPCLYFHLPCLGLGLALISIYLASASGWQPLPWFRLASFPAFTALANALTTSLSAVPAS